MSDNTFTRQIKLKFYKINRLGIYFKSEISSSTRKVVTCKISIEWPVVYEIRKQSYRS